MWPPASVSPLTRAFHSSGRRGAGAGALQGEVPRQGGKAMLQHPRPGRQQVLPKLQSSTTRPSEPDVADSH